MFDRAHRAAPEGLLCRGRLERKCTFFPPWSVISDPVHFPGKSGDISDISVISVPPRSALGIFHPLVFLPMLLLIVYLFKESVLLYPTLCSRQVEFHCLPVY